MFKGKSDFEGCSFTSFHSGQVKEFSEAQLDGNLRYLLILLRLSHPDMEGVFACGGDP